MDIAAGSSASFLDPQRTRWRDRFESTPASALTPASRPTAAAATDAAGTVNAVTSAALLDYRASDRTSIYIRTQEGDLVRIRIRSGQSLHAESATATSGEQQLAVLNIAASSSQSLRLTIEGNLNADELKAIQAVVNQAGALANQFFAGDLSAAFDAAAQLNIDSSQLAVVGLRFSARQQLTYAAAHSPATDAAAAAPDTTADTATAATLGKIGSFLGQLLQTLASTKQNNTPAADTDGGPNAASGANTPGLQLSLSLKIRIFRSVLVNAAQLTEAAKLARPAGASQTTLPDLLPQTLDALAARQAPPVTLKA